MRFRITHQIQFGILFLLVCLSNGLALAQSPNCRSIVEIDGQGMILDSGLVPVDCCACNDICLRPRSCLTSRIMCHVGGRHNGHKSPVPMPQRFPYETFRMPYYGRPYRPADNAKYDASSFTDDAFEAARREVNSYLSKDANLEYADAPRGFWPQR